MYMHTNIFDETQIERSYPFLSLLHVLVGDNSEFAVTPNGLCEIHSP